MSAHGDIDHYLTAALFRAGHETRAGVAIRDPAHFVAFVVACAEAYDRAPVFDAGARKAWDVLNRHNTEVMIRRIAGSGIEIESTPDDPYGGPGGIAMKVRRMLWDVVVNKHLLVYSGTTSDHPVFSEHENTVFRTVHDYLAHGKMSRVLRQEAKALGLLGRAPSDAELEAMLPRIDLTKHGNKGHSFALRGEFNAYSTHAKVAPRAAVPALFTEVVGQNCMFACTGDFAVQKVAVLGDFDFINVGLARPGTRAEARMQDILRLVNEGAEGVDTTIAGTPRVSVPRLMRVVTRNAKVGRAQAA